MNDVARKILFPNTRPDTRVHRAWDIGFSDECTVTWFCGDKILLEQTFVARPLADIVSEINKRNLGPIGLDYVPPDAECRSWATGETLVDSMRALGLNPKPVHPLDV